MKITFISPYFHNVWEPLGPAYIKAYCDKNLVQEHKWNFFHGNFDSEKDIIESAIQSDIVAFSCTTPTFKNGYELAKKIKEKNPRVFIVFGGWHPTTASIDADKVIDLVIYREGEVSFHRLIRDFYRDHIATIFMNLFLEFDKLPWPDRDFIHQNRFLDLCEKQCGERILSFQSRRGCMMNCTMCGENHISGKGVRYRDSIDLLDEIEFTFDKYNATMFKFVDPTWSYPMIAAKEFCYRKLRRNDFKWEGMVHASFLDRELMQLMKESGCIQMNVGCESGSQKILNSIKKGTTVQQIKRVFKWGKELDIDMRAFFIIGMPDETSKDIELSKQLIRDIEPSVLGVTILCPYPGTEYYRDEFEEINWEKVDEYNSFWSTEHFTNEELYKIQKEIYTEFKDIVVGHQKCKIEE